MADNSFKVKNSLVLTPVDLTSLTNPQAGDLACDINDSNKIKRYDSNSLSWAEVGAAGIGGVDILFSQDFESSSLASFTQTGLSLSQVTPLHGKVSALMTHQAGVSPTNDQKFKQVVAVDEKFRGQAMLLELNVKSTATAGNVTLNVYDETNAANIVASEQLTLSSDTGGIKVFSAFTIPVTCLSMSYTITALPEAGSPVTRIDDILCQLNNASLLETSVTVPNITAWQGYIPVFTGFGTATNIEFEWRQVGENAEIRGKFASGTTTPVEARIGLPSGLTSAGTGLIPSIQMAGKAVRGNAGANTIKAFVMLIEPSVTYMTLGRDDYTSAINPLTKQNGNAVASLPEEFSFFASVPCAGLTATSDVAIPLTQSGIVQEADSYIKLHTANGYGSTNTAIPRFLTMQTSVGNGIIYQDSPTLGNSFTAVEDGVYSFTGLASTVVSTTNFSIGLSLNSSALSTGVTSQTNNALLIVARDSINTAASNAKVVPFAWTGKLLAGDVVRLHGDTQTLSDILINATYQGSLKQVTVNTNSKITIPTSELRFEGASARGAVATFVAKFDTIAKIRGDAFTVTNTANDGTFVTMTKAGKLDINTSIYFTASRQVSLSKNQTVLTLDPTASEMLASEYSTGTNDAYSLSWSGFVSIGDVLRVIINGAPIANVLNNFNLSFQEQEIQVSVSNTLPQFSESDSSVRLDTANGYGSTATKIRRFSNVTQNIGSDIQYNPNSDEATNGASFKVMESGIYSIAYADQFNSANWLGISKNASSLTTNISAIGNSERLILTTTAGISFNNVANWQGELVVGDIIRAHTDGTVSGAQPDRASFTISKVGKPNVTGVDVTPFVNVPQPEWQTARVFNTSSFTSADITGSLDSNTNNGIFSYNSTTGEYTILKSSQVFTVYGSRSNGASYTEPTILVNGSIVAVSDSVATSAYTTTTSYNFKANTGDVIKFRANGAVASINHRISVTATALSDQILTAPETFSTDTASLQYAPSSTYTLSTLANAPVGTFITYTYAINTNTRTQTTTAPTQTTSDMNTNGILLYTRPYNTASTAAQPSVMAIQIGKGLKGISLAGFNGIAKTTPVELDMVVRDSTVQYGLASKAYDEKTGILNIDAGYAALTTNIAIRFLAPIVPNDYTSGYLVINASKNPALTGLNINNVRLKAVDNAGQVLTSLVTNIPYTTVLDTHGAWNGTQYTVPESGSYTIGIGVQYTTSAASSIILYINGTLNKYITDGITQAYNVGGYTDYFTKGQVLSFRNTRSGTLLSTTDTNYLTITKVSVG